MKFRWHKDIFDLLFPNLCHACGNQKLNGQEVICFSCHRKLPETGMHSMKENRFTDRFMGKIYLQSGAAMYHFRDGNPVQRLIHKLKYKQKSKIGLSLGEKYGRQLSQSEYFSKIDVIVPVPLHPVKERKRGYNQSDQFAIGLSETMQKPWLKNGLVRVKYGKSQTTKSRAERYEEVMESFVVGEGKQLEGKHILLVDDVLTTGATLEACATKILEVPNTTISMATIAIAGTT